MPQIKHNKSVLRESGWRLLPSLYAEHMGRGAWIRYNWIEQVLEHIRRAVVRGNARIIVNSPPRHGKSEGTSFWLPAWYLDLFPEKRVILGSYGNNFAAKWGRRVRNHFETHPETLTQVGRDRSAASDWLTTAGGGMLSIGVGGSVTGEGGNCIIIDDPHKNWEEALSPTYRRRVQDWFNSVLYTRQEPGASIIIVQTRWHEADLSGYLLNEHSDNWEHINCPALAEGNDFLGREPGEVLCSERFTAEALTRIKSAMSSYMFAGLYQQRPAPLEGGFIKRDWFNRYSEAPETLVFDEMIQSWDATFKAGGSSFVTGQVWGRKGANYFIVDQFRDKVDFPETLRAIERMTNRWPAATDKIIEEAANGHAIIATLRDQIPGIIGIPPRGSKIARLVSVSGLFESGNVWVPAQSVAAWGDDFVEELVNFPNGANDDQVDGASMALTRLTDRPQSFNMVIPTAGSRPSPWSFNA